jgi:RNA polymerase sigma-70 factor (ECF subfamily)
MNDAELAKNAKEGDEEAFAELVKRHLPAVYTFLARYTGDDALAEDATQETFVKAWRNLSRFDASKPLRPWLMRIARNAANDTLRKKRALPFSRLFALRDEGDDFSFEDTLADEAPLPPELFEKRELAETVQRALAELPERDRALLLMRYEDEFPFEDIATALSAPLNTVKSWHRRALIRLRAIIAPKSGHDA